ncbi:MAG: hypothetical protein NC409_13700 [Clostridium sp.]|nr:hypothetical protein [Clostridium sp.]
MKLIYLEFMRLAKKRWLSLWFFALLGISLWVSGLFLDREYEQKGVTPEEYLREAAQYEGLALDDIAEEVSQKNERIMQAFTAVTMYRSGSMNHDEAAAMLADCGYSDINLDQIDTAELYTAQTCSRLLWREMELQLQYDDYLAQLKKGTSGLAGLSFFNEDVYTARTNKKAMQDYAALNISPDVWHHNTAAREFLQNRIADAAAFVFLMTILLLLYTEEREKNYSSLTGTTTRGKHSFYLRKLAVLFAYTSITVAFYEAGLLLYYTARAGRIAWNAPVQSISAFSMCPKAYTILYAVLITVFFKIVFFFILMLLLSVLACLFSKTISFLGTAAALAVLFVLWMKTGNVNATLGWLTYLNPIHLTDTARLFIGYQNVNLFQYPVSALWIVGTAGAAGLIGGFLGGCFLYGRVYRRRFLFHRKKTRESRRRFHRMPLFFLELYKILFSYRFLIPLCIAVAGFSLYYARSAPIALSFQEQFYEDYMLTLNGPLTEDKEDFLQTERQRFEQLTELKAQLLQQENPGILLTYIEQMLMEKQAFDLVEQRYLRLRSSDGASVFLYETGYLYLFGFLENGRGRTGLLLLVILLALLTPWFFWIEFKRGAADLMRTTAHGRCRRIVTQYGCCYLLLFLLAAFAYAGECYSVFRQFGTYGLDQTISNIAEMASFPVSVRIGVYLFFVQVIRAFGLALTLLMAMALMYLCRDYLKTTLLCCVLTVLPYLLYMNGFSFMNGYFLNAFLTGNELLLLIQDEASGKLILIAVQTLACLGLSAAVLKKEVGQR